MIVTLLKNILEEYHAYEQTHKTIMRSNNVFLYGFVDQTGMR